jgi:hypothetical protein
MAEASPDDRKEAFRFHSSSDNDSDIDAPLDLMRS